MRLVMKALCLMIILGLILAPMIWAQRNLSKELAKYSITIDYPNELTSYPITLRVSRGNYIDGLSIQSSIKREKNDFEIVKIDDEFILNMKIGEIVNKGGVIATKQNEEVVSHFEGRLIDERTENNEKILVFDVVENYALEFGVDLKDIWFINKLNNNEFNIITIPDYFLKENIELELRGYRYIEDKYIVRYEPVRFYHSIFNDYPVYFTFRTEEYKNIYILHAKCIKEIDKYDRAVITYLVKLRRGDYEIREIAVSEYKIRSDTLYILEYNEKYLPSLDFILYM